jgi:hypothetical protein
VVVLFASGIVPSLKIGDADFKASTLTWEMVGQLRAFAADLMPNSRCLTATPSAASCSCRAYVWRWVRRHEPDPLPISTAAGLAVIGAGALWTGAILVVLLRGLIQPIPPPLVAVENPGPDRVPALARLARPPKVGRRRRRDRAMSLLPVLPRGVLYGTAVLLLAASAVAVAKRSTLEAREP